MFASRLRHRPLLTLARLLLAGSAACVSPGATYKNAARTPDDRAADLLARMTPEEKFWQLFAVPDDTTLDLTRLQHGIYGLQVRPGLGGGAR